MKKTIIVAAFLNLSVYAFAQTDNPIPFDDYSTHIFFHLGIIRNEVKTESENSTIKGSPSGNRSVALSVFHFFKNHRTAISLQGNYYDEYSSPFYTTSDREFDTYYRFDIGYSSYYKFGLNYNYKLKIGNRTDLLFYAGPSVFVQTKTGMYNSFEKDAPPSVNVPPYYVVAGNFYKIRKTTLGSQFGANLLRKAKRKGITLSLNIGYSLGFQDFYEGRINTRQYSDGVNLDNAIIRGRGNGLYGFIGFSIPIM